jgi:tetratricopeptide (TPR) repeat protein
MKHYFSFVLLFACPFFCHSQEKETKSELKLDSASLLKEIAANACQCIDSIPTGTKTSQVIAAEIHACIDKHTVSYQMGMKLASINTLDGQKETKIEINTNADSKEYKEYYYDMERYLTDNCPALKTKMATNDKLNDKSVSQNSEAIKYYNLGLEESKKENYEKAIEYYKKAVVFDPEFAFAYDNIGICSRMLNKFDEAEDAYEKSLKIDPNGSMPLQNIAVVCIYKKEYKKAVRAYERLSKIEPENPEVFYGIGNIYAQYLLDYEKALDNLCTAYTLYTEQKSPYRTDAEKLIQIVYSGMKKEGKEAAFNAILTRHNISPN